MLEIKVEAQRVVWVVDADLGDVEQAFNAVARVRSDEDRLGRCLVGRTTIVEQAFDVYADVLAELRLDLSIQPDALARRLIRLKGWKLKRSAVAKLWKSSVRGPAAGFAGCRRNPGDAVVDRQLGSLAIGGGGECSDR